MPDAPAKIAIQYSSGGAAPRCRWLGPNLIHFLTPGNGLLFLITHEIMWLFE